MILQVEGGWKRASLRSSDPLCSFDVRSLRTRRTVLSASPARRVRLRGVCVLSAVGTEKSAQCWLDRSVSLCVLAVSTVDDDDYHYLPTFFFFPLLNLCCFLNSFSFLRLFCFGWFYLVTLRVRLLRLPKLERHGLCESVRTVPLVSL